VVSLQLVQRPQYRTVFGEAIRAYRRDAQLTQEGLAERAGLNPKYLGEVERGNKECSLTSMVKIAKALGVRVRNLVRDV